MNKTLKLIGNIQDIKGVKFASFTYLSKKTKELARHTVLLGFSYQNLLEKSLVELNAILPSLTTVDEKLAGQELLESIMESIVKHKIGEQNSRYTKKGQYTSVGNGLNVNETDDTLQLFGLVQSKVVLVEGEYKTVKSSAKTIAKNKIRKCLSTEKFREFALDPETVACVKISGETIEFVSNLSDLKNIEGDLTPAASVVIENKKILVVG